MPGEGSRLVLNGLRFHISAQMWKKKQLRADETDGGRAAALIAPCDSATSDQPINWQQSRKVTLCAGGDGKQQLQVRRAVQHRGGGGFSGTNVTGRKQETYI